MWDLGANFNLVALVVSVVALTISVSSLLGQFFATADGYRRCQPSVMGPWARLTRRNWRMAQFRFDTVFTTPEFFLKEDAAQSRNEYTITGDGPSRKRTFTPDRENVSESFELVSWIHFLQVLHEESQDALQQNAVTILRPQILTSVPAVRLRKKSWDLMPPDVVSPLASTSLSDICILARRLGMTWKEFRPYEGEMSAEGPGHVLNSTTVRGLGRVLQYTYLYAVDRPRRDMHIWKTEADKMGFGILPGNPDFAIPEFNIGTQREIIAWLTEADPSEKAAKHVQDVMKSNPGWPSAFSDLIPIAAPMLRNRGSTVIRLPAPGDQEIAYGPSVLTCVQYGFTAFAKRLQEIASKSLQLGKIWGCYSGLLDKHGAVWENDSVAESTERSLEFLNDVHDSYDETTTYFQLLEGEGTGFRYLDLVKAHITHAVHFWPESHANVVEGRGREDFWRHEGMHVYFDYLPKYAQTMRQRGFGDEAKVRDAWVTLIFRAFCWQRCHFMIRGSTIPSHYYGSRLPVYIG